LQRLRNVFRRQRKLRGGQDPRELQRLSVEARLRRKQEQASGVADSVSHQPDVGRALDAGRRRRDSSVRDIRSHQRPQLPKPNPTRRTTQDVLAEIDAKYPAEKPRVNRGLQVAKVKLPAPQDPNRYGDFPAEPGELASDYWLRRALHMQLEWSRKQQANGTVEVTWPRLVVPDHWPEFF
jgi:hypothetical protein